MPTIFICYGRADRSFVDRIVPLIHQVHGLNSVWFDGRIRGGDEWWQVILDQIAHCELFVYVISNESMNSPYCQAELREARRLHKPILPLRVRPGLDYPERFPQDLKEALVKIQYLEMAPGVRDTKEVTEFYAALKQGLERKPPSPLIPLAPEPVLCPAPLERTHNRNTQYLKWGIGALLAALTIGAIIIGLSVFMDDNALIGTPVLNAVDDSNIQLSPKPLAETPTNLIDATTTPMPTFTVMPVSDTATFTHTPSITPSPEPLATAIPTLIPAHSSNSAWITVTRQYRDVLFVEVPAGCFMMGTDEGEHDEHPAHELCLDDFWIMKTEVTRAMYAACAAAGGCTAIATPNIAGNDNQPINHVNWDQANDFCDWLDARLPSESEWEYAARGPEGWLYPWGNEFIPDNAVYINNSGDQIAQVGSMPGGASWVGALDMSGNVWEWTSSFAKPYPYNRRDGREGTSNLILINRVTRGGSYANESEFLRAANRSSYSPDTAIGLIGFRCAHK
ncbi:MAG: SUMF1/EgtB/PvdO family nonheme iron enzyme [Anaerolineae bacterium]|nr:SUMF1/EgtB/PvdO family nonheme iron enzyme [Anaerolineae bacterium]